jgi:NAD(P)-dependent dehydrogenase (short-subunit alcohol dehydrogenase family)
MTTWLVTGANRGIGLAMAMEIVARGDRVIATVRDPFRVPEFLKTAPAKQLMVIGMDVGDANSVARAAASVKEPVDILVNNAGINPKGGQGPFDIDYGVFADALAINAMSPLRVSNAFLPQLKQAANPRILTVSSQMGASVYGGSDRLVYRVSKAAANKTMQVLAEALKPEGVTVAVIHPGWVRTDMGGPAASLSPEESAKGCLDVAAGMTPADAGKFFRWDGTIHPW